jgi:hypothetical protein
MQLMMLQFVRGLRPWGVPVSTIAEESTGSSCHKLPLFHAFRAPLYEIRHITETVLYKDSIDVFDDANGAETYPG